MTEAFRHRLLLAVILLGAALLRLPGLGADPSTHLGTHFVSDEGWWVHNARNRVLFDRWVVDDFNQSLFAAPTYCLPTALAFRLLGVGFAPARLTAALAGIVLPLAAWWLLGVRLRRPREGLLAAAMLAGSYPLVCLGRVALTETLMLLFLTLSWGLWVTRRGSVGAAGSGILWGLALLTKTYALFLLPVIGSMVLLELWSRRGRHAGRLALQVGGFTIGVALVMAGYWFWIIRPYQDQFLVMYDLWVGANLPQGLARTVRNIGGSLAQAAGGRVQLRRFWPMAAPVLAAAWLAGVARLDRREQEEPPPVEQLRVAVYAWLVWGTVAIAPLAYKPMRRYVILLPPLAILAALEAARGRRVNLAALWRPGAGPGGITRNLVGAALLILPFLLVATVPLVNIVAPAATGALAGVNLGFDRGVGLESILLVGLVVVAVGGLTVWFVLRRWGTGGGPTIAFTPVMLLALVLLLDASRGFWLVAHPTYSLRDLSRRLGQERLVEGTVIFGGLANSLCLENRAFAFPYWGRHEHGRILNERPIERFAPDYLVITTRMDYPWPLEERYRVLVRPENLLETVRACPVQQGHRIEAQLYSLEGVEDVEVISTGPTVLR